MGGGYLTNQTHSRRVHGLQLPFNYLQVFGWIVLILTGFLNFLILAVIQLEPLKLAALVVYAILYGLHIITHLLAMGLDPSETEIRKRGTIEVPEFDRHLHAHVIENGRCHLCNIYTSDKKTKHCGICNKCVYRFDHHCKWLNNCVGERNYSAFIGCVTTALCISMFTFSLCIIDVVIFFENPLNFGETALNFINCTNIMAELRIQNCKNSIAFITFLIVYLVCSGMITCALLHLLCFHIYISVLGISTYDYIIRNKRSPLEFSYISKCLRMPNLYFISNKKDKKQTDLIKIEPGVGNLISIIVNYELEKAKKLFHYDRNKIHPVQQNVPGKVERE